MGSINESGVGENGQSDRQVRVRFTTKLPPHLRVTSAPFAVPAKLARYGLSEVINTLLGLEKPQPFDFLVDGELVRTSLERLLISKQLSTESILTLEYVPAVAPPHKDTAAKHDDWVSAVYGRHNNKLIVTGSYDANARLWDRQGACVCVLQGHTDAINDVASVPTTSANTLRVVAASKDRTLRMWEVPGDVATNASKIATTAKHTPVRVFKGHTAAVEAVASSPDGRLLCSGGWDLELKFWQSNGVGSAEEGGKALKRQKVGSNANGVALEEVSVERSLAGHTQCISSLDWPSSSSDTVYSSSWDRSVRLWDVETCTNTDTLTSSKAVYTLSIDSNTRLVATGGADPTIRVWDTRARNNSTTPAMRLSTATNSTDWVSAVRFSPSQAHQHQLLAAYYDGSLRLWDVRGKVPLHTVTHAHEGKALALDWLGEGGDEGHDSRASSFASGGEDGRMVVYSMSSGVLQQQDRTDA